MEIVVSCFRECDIDTVYEMMTLVRHEKKQSNSSFVQLS